MKSLWTFKHEPITIDDMIVTDEKKKTLTKIMNELPNTLIAGKPGTGKGTFMNILLRKTGVDCLKINGSDETGIDVVRDKIKSFATAYSLNKKIVYINEGDRLSVNAQNSLNAIIEDVQHITRFFFVCNNPSRLTAPILSRCSYQIDLNDPPAKDLYAYMMNLLKKENVTVKNKASVINIIKKLYPDIRKIIGTLQSNVNNGVIDDVSFNTQSDVYQKVFDYMLKNDVENVRKILKGYIDYTELYGFMYKQIMDDPDTVKLPAEFILETGKYLYRNEIVLIKEINFMAYVFSLMKGDVI